MAATAKAILKSPAIKLLNMRKDQARLVREKSESEKGGGAVKLSQLFCD